MRNKIKTLDILFVVFLIITIATTAHFTLIDRVGFWRLIYPLQGHLAIWNIHCSNNAPVWMKDRLNIL